MAIAKDIQLDNGVRVLYHRVVAVSIYTNVQVTIELRSYASEGKRAEERIATETSQPMDVFTRSRFYQAPYDNKSMTVAAAYEWIKANVAEFRDAVDVLDGQEVAQ
ncbi:hypothetical protein [Gordonibacter sp.]|uniref:hypothetical protein n=1 Tax=Gordonibacter sp. TaxID=1968902 RepID=UPI002FC5DB3C